MSDIESPQARKKIAIPVANELVRRSRIKQLDRGIIAAFTQ
jgi:hypothetical protein